MAATRGSENRPEPGSDYFTVEPDLAGVSRSGKKRLVPPESEELAAESLTNLPGNQSADCQENFVPALAGVSGLNTAGSTASRLVTQVAGGSGQLRDKEVVQLVGTSESDRSDSMSETTEDNEKLDDAPPPSVGEDDLETEVIVVEASPTHFDASKLPKTINAGSFRAIVVRATGYRTQIQKSLSNMDRIIAELEELEKEDDDNDDDDFVDGLWKEIGDEYSKVKKKQVWP